MLAKPIKTLEWHYPIIQFLIKIVYRIERQLSVKIQRLVYIFFFCISNQCYHTGALAGQAPVRGDKNHNIVVST